MDIRKEVEDIERSLREEEEAIEHSLVKYLKITITFVIVLLLLSYFIIEPNVRDVITGYFESETVLNNKFYYEDNIIIFEHNTYVELRRLFKENQETEFRVCLRGFHEGFSYLVHDIIRPNVHSSSVFQVVSEPCPENTIIDLHSHPYQKCIASQTDLKLLEKEKRTNPGILMAVMCTEDRISFYG